MFSPHDGGFPPYDFFYFRTIYVSRTCFPTVPLFFFFLLLKFACKDRHDKLLRLLLLSGDLEGDLAKA